MSALLELKELIQSMTMNEKRYFRIHSERDAGAKDEASFLKLFDLIHSHSKSDEQSLKKLIGKLKLGGQIGVHQSYLRHQLLRSMQMYRAATDPEIKILNLLAEIQILSSNKLMKQAVKCLARLRKMVEAECRIELLPDVLLWTDVFIRRGWLKGNREVLMENLEQDRLACREALSSDFAIRNYNAQILSFFNEAVDSRDPILQAKVLSIEKKLMALNIGERFTEKLLAHYYQSLFFAAFSIADFGKSMQYSQKHLGQLAIMQKQKKGPKAQLNFLEPWMNYQEAAMLAGDFTESEKASKIVKEQLDKLKKQLTIQQKMYVSLTSLSRTIRFYLLQNDLPQTKKPYNKLLKELTQYESKLTLGEYINYYFPVMVVDFYLGKFKNSRDKCASFLERGEGKEFRHYRMKARMLELMNLAELGSWDEHAKLTKVFLRSVKRNAFKMLCETNFGDLQMAISKNRGNDKSIKSAFLKTLSAAHKMSKTSVAEKGHHLDLNLFLYYQQGAEGTRSY